METPNRSYRDIGRILEDVDLGKAERGSVISFRGRGYIGKWWGDEE